MNKTLCVKVLDLCKNGKFQIALELVEKLEDDIWIKILVNCCHSCLNSEINICTENLFRLLERIIPMIRNPNELELLSYIQSVYHIMNSFIKKDSFHIISKMEDILLPSFLPAKLEKMHKNTMNSIAVILFNLVVVHAQENDRSKNAFMLKLSLMVTKISMRVLESTDALNRSYKSLVNLVCLKAVSVEEEIEYFKEVLSLCTQDTHDGQKKGEYFKLILNFSCIILNDILKTFDFQKVANLFQTISKIIFVEDHSELLCLYQVLNSCLVISPLKIANLNGELVKCMDSLNALDRMISESDFVEKLRDKLLIVFSRITYYYQNVQRKKWADLPESLQLEVLHFVSGIADTHYDHSFLSLQIVLQLIEVQVREKPNSSSIARHEKYLEILNMFLDKILYLKENNLDAWKKLWNVMGMRLYNIGVVQWKNNSNLSALLYLEFFMKMHLLLETNEDDSPKVLKKPAMSSCLRVMCEMHMNEPKMYLAYTALAIFLCPASGDAFMNEWIKIKHSERESKAPGFEEIQQVTLLSALELLIRDSSLIKGPLGNSEKLILLKIELEHYKKRWKSKIPISSVVKELHKQPDVKRKAEIIADIFGDVQMPVLDDCLAIFKEILCAYKARVMGGSRTVESEIRLGMLNYIVYKYTLMQTIAKNAEDMERIALVIDAVTESSEKCDVFSAYESSSLDQYLESKLSYLDASLDIFSSIVLDEQSEMRDSSAFQMYNCLLHIFYEYRLLGHRFRCLQAAQLALSLAQLLKNSLWIVQTTGFIIEFSTDNRSSQYIEEADDLLEYLDISKEENLRVIMIYYICKSKALFRRNQKEAYRVFRLCKDLIESRKDEMKADFGTVESQLHQLNFKFATLPCELGIENHEEHTLMDLHNATAMVYKKFVGHDIVASGVAAAAAAYDMSILLEAASELVRHYEQTRCPRDVYAHGREALALAQRLVAPLRCAALLASLAHADLRSAALCDCRSKLDGMAQILGLPATAGAGAPRQPAPSSPAVRAPAFLEPPHAAACACFRCACVEYQALAVRQTGLTALWHVKRGDVEAARAHFRAALRSLDVYCAAGGGFDEFLSIRAFLSLHYAGHLDRTDGKVEARDVVERLIERLAERKSDFVYLYDEAVALKAVYMMESLMPDEEPWRRELDEDMDRLAIDDDAVAKTPETNYTSVFFPVKCKTPDAGMSAAKHPRVNKRLLFPASPNDEEIPVRPTTAKKRSQAIDKSTPLPKIHIYTERRAAERKTSVRKKAVPIPTTADAKTLKPETSSSSSSSLPHPELKTKTRLLTEKLKKAAKAAPPGGGDAPTDRSYPSRKNLLRDLEAASEDAPPSATNTGAVRKSTRRKK